MKLSLALDWTPNAIHAGFFLALIKGWYNEADLDVELISPLVDQYEVTPIEKLFRKQAFFAIAPSEMVIKYHQLGYSQLIAIASVLQGSPSAFASLKETNINSKEELKGKKYAALELPFEKAILNTLTGGTVEYLTPQKLDIYKLLFQKKVDFVWVFKNIERIEAKLKGMELTLFDLEKSGIDYGPCTLLVTHQDYINSNAEEIKKFLAVTNRAYIEVADNPEQSTAFLLANGKEYFSDEELLKQTINASVEYYLDETKRWGKMDEQRWQKFLTWLETNKQLDKGSVQSKALYSNSFWTSN